MKFRIKSTSKLQPEFRSRIHMNSLTDLLPAKALVALPEQTLNNKFQCHTNLRIQKKLRDVNLQSCTNLKRVMGLTEKASNKMMHYWGRCEMNLTLNNSSSWKVFNSSNLQNQQKEQSRLSLFRHRSLELNREIRQKQNNKMWTAVHHQYSPLAVNNQPKSTPSPKTPFLRKGSNINKRVVVNLIKLKLMNSQPAADPEKERKIGNNDILHMIKIYKGYGQGHSLQQNIENMRITNEAKVNRNPLKNHNIQLSLSSWREKRGESLLERDEVIF